MSHGAEIGNRFLDAHRCAKEATRIATIDASLEQHLEEYKSIVLSARSEYLDGNYEESYRVLKNAEQKAKFLTNQSGWPRTPDNEDFAQRFREESLPAVKDLREAMKDKAHGN